MCTNVRRSGLVKSGDRKTETASIKRFLDLLPEQFCFWGNFNDQFPATGDCLVISKNKVVKEIYFVVWGGHQINDLAFGSKRPKLKDALNLQSTFLVLQRVSVVANVRQRSAPKTVKLVGTPAPCLTLHGVPRTLHAAQSMPLPPCYTVSLRAA